MEKELYQSSKILKIYSLPCVTSVSIPYLNLFYGAIAEYGIYNVGEFQPTIRWIKTNQKKIEAIHIHWPEKIWRMEYTPMHNAFKGVKGYYAFRRMSLRIWGILGLFMFVRVLRLLKKNNFKIIWTAHELEPHSSLGRIDHIGYQKLAACSDLVIVHSQASKQLFFSQYGVFQKIIVMRHGNFKDAYPKPRPKEVVLTELGLDKTLPIVCLLGALRSYKGIDLALQVAAKFVNKVNFLIGGPPLDHFIVDAMMGQVKQMNNVLMIPRALTKQEFADLAGASEAFLLPYTNITTSGVMHAAFTFGSGIVATSLPYFQEALQEHPECGRLAQNYNADSFVEAINSYLEIPEMRRIAAARKFTDETNWAKVIKPVVAFIKDWK
jgi:glycosyltransferase involved in cell wall biosynthesis